MVGNTHTHWTSGEQWRPTPFLVGGAVRCRTLDRLVGEDRGGSGDYKFTYTVTGIHAGHQDKWVIDDTPDSPDPHSPDTPAVEPVSPEPHDPQSDASALSTPEPSPDPTENPEAVECNGGPLRRAVNTHVGIV